MSTTAMIGGFQNASHQSARAFRALMNVLARPGQIEELTGGQAPAPVSEAAATLLLTLADKDTPIYLAAGWDLPEVRDWITFHTGAPFGGPEEAAFALGDWASLQPVTRFAIGTSEYPDRSTTMIVEMPQLSAQGAALRGPGIKDVAHLSLPEEAAFKANARLFPLGLDFYFTAGAQVAALPRTTQVGER